jgi:hypothetical protein
MNKNKKYKTTIYLLILLIIALTVFSAVTLLTLKNVAYWKISAITGSILTILIIAIIIFINSYSYFRTLNNEIVSKVKTIEEKNTEISKLLARIKDKDKEKDIIEGINNIDFKGITPETDNAEEFCEAFLRNISHKIEISSSIVFLKKRTIFYPAGTYALISNNEPKPFEEGKGLNGQVAKNKAPMIIDDVPEDYFVTVSGLGKAKPEHLYILPVISNNIVIAIIELSSFKDINNEIHSLITFLPKEAEKFSKLKINA